MLEPVPPVEGVPVWPVEGTVLPDVGEGALWPAAEAGMGAVRLRTRKTAPSVRMDR